jgi:2'-5' RNA ligase
VKLYIAVFPDLKSNFSWIECPWGQGPIPFVPHLTVAAGISLEEAKAIADSLNSKRFAAEFKVEAVSVVNIEDHGRDRKVSAPIMLGR